VLLRHGKFQVRAVRVPKWSRRRVLVAFAASVLVAGTGIARLRASGYRVEPRIARSLKALRAWQYAVIEAVGARILAPENVHIGGFADSYIAELPAEDRRDLQRFLAYVEHLAPLAEGYLRRFTSLSPAAQDEVLSALESSSIADLCAGFQALKSLALMDYYRRPANWPKLGYGGPLIVY
jgi:hypothetical protein